MGLRCRSLNVRQTDLFTWKRAAEGQVAGASNLVGWTLRCVKAPGTWALPPYTIRTWRPWMNELCCVPAREIRGLLRAWSGRWQGLPTCRRVALRHACELGNRSTPSRTLARALAALSNISPFPDFRSLAALDAPGPPARSWNSDGCRSLRELIAQPIKFRGNARPCQSSRKSPT